MFLLDAIFKTDLFWECPLFLFLPDLLIISSGKQTALNLDYNAVHMNFVFLSPVTVEISYFSLNKIMVPSKAHQALKVFHILNMFS